MERNIHIAKQTQYQKSRAGCPAGPAVEAKQRFLHRKQKKRKKTIPRKILLPLFSFVGLAFIVAVCVLICAAVTAAGSVASIGSNVIPTENNNSTEQQARLPVAREEGKPEETDKNQPATSAILNVRTICQNPELPTGCEATAAVMALNYLGGNIYLESFAEMIPCQQIQDRDGRRNGPDPNDSFAGSPFKNTESFGCFEQVIIRTVNENYPDFHAQQVNGSLTDLCGYIDSGYPVVVWVTMEMQEIQYKTLWVLPDGTDFVWPGREHCMLLVGYDETFFYFNDPRAGDCVAYDKDLSQLRFEEMGSRAVVIQSIS